MRKRYIQDPQTLELVPYEEYYARREVNAPMVMPDIKPYQSMQTGEMIKSRSHHREHLRQHGLIEIGNEVKAHMQQRSAPKVDKQGIRNALIESVRRHMG